MAYNFIPSSVHRPVSSSSAAPNSPKYDALFQAQMMQQQSAYSGEHKDFRRLKSKGEFVNNEVKKTTVVRKGGGQVWDDQTLLAWDPS